MSVAFYMDENIPRAVTNGLRLRGIDVLTAQEDFREGTPDPILLDRAAELNRVIFTQDEDFLAEAKRRQEKGINFIGVIYIHHHRLIFGDCINDLEIIAQVSELEDLANRVQYLPL
jgi:predicted nuclease of predicted toxin-antitoxin system